jgi:hypothetical protein
MAGTVAMTRRLSGPADRGKKATDGRDRSDQGAASNERLIGSFPPMCQFTGEWPV